MSIESIKSEIAKVIAAGCDITRPQAVKLIEHAVRPISGAGQRKVAIPGLGDVFFRIEKTAPIRKTKKTQSQVSQSHVVAELTSGNRIKLVTFGGLEGDPATTPPDFPPIDIEKELGSILERQARIFFTSRGHPFVAQGAHAPSRSTPSVKITTLRRQS